MIFRKSSTSKLLCSLTLATLLGACTNQQLANTKAIQRAAAQLASETNNSIESIVDNANQAYAQAKQDELAIYAPLHMETALDHLANAEKLLQASEQQPNVALTEAIAAQKTIQDAYAFSQKNSPNIKDLVARKVILDEHRASERMPKEYDDLMQDFKSIVRQIEEGNLEAGLDDKPDLIHAFKELEVALLNESHLDSARSFLEKADAIDASDYAPKAYLNALKEIEAAEIYIAKNNRNRIGVEEAGKKALKAAQIAYYTAKDAKKLVNMTPSEAERHVNGIFSSLNRINKSATSVALLPQSYEHLADKLNEIVTLLKKHNIQLSKALLDTENELASLHTQLEKQKSQLDLMAETAWGSDDVSVHSSNQLFEMSDD